MINQNKGNRFLSFFFHPTDIELCFDTDTEKIPEKEYAFEEVEHPLWKNFILFCLVDEHTSNFFHPDDNLFAPQTK